MILIITLYIASTDESMHINTHALNRSMGTLLLPWLIWLSVEKLDSGSHLTALKCCAIHSYGDAYSIMTSI